MSDYHWIIEKPLITEKSMEMLHANNWVAFAVHRKANKIQIKTAVEKIFNVKVLCVNTVRVGGKLKRFGRTLGRAKDWKKALVRLKEGDKIEIFEGV
ncbi:MAG: 50S ribosomal protein L23 [Nitrospinales bacterium]